MAGGIYLDSSAIVKLVRREPGSAELVAFAAGHGPLITSRITGIEIGRAFIRRGDASSLAGSMRQIAAVVEVTAAIARCAAAMHPSTLGPMAAIHLATALQFHGELTAFVTYDHRLADAAWRLGVEVVAPGMAEHTVAVASELPGQDLVDRGLVDLAGGLVTIEAMLVANARSRFTALGIEVPPSVIDEPTIELYRLVDAEVGERAAHSRYNALRRRVLSYLAARRLQMRQGSATTS